MSSSKHKQVKKKTINLIQLMFIKRLVFVNLKS